jgi:hypothetical protein
VAASYHNGHDQSRFHTAAHQSAFMMTDKQQIEACLCFLTGDRVTDHPCVTENIEGETGENRVGKQRRSMDVAEKSPPHMHTGMSGNSVYPSLSPREAANRRSKRDPFSCYTQLRYVLSLSETSICRGKTDSIDHSIRGGGRFACEYLLFRIAYCISKKKKLRPVQGTWLGDLRHGTIASPEAACKEAQ